MTSDSTIIGDDKVVSFHYKLSAADGSINESSEGQSPVVYLHVRNAIVPGLETQLAGKKSGDKFTATRSAERPKKPSRLHRRLRLTCSQGPCSEHNPGDA